MNLTDKRFWIAWLLLLILAIVSCMTEGWCEDVECLGGFQPFNRFDDFYLRN